MLPKMERKLCFVQLPSDILAHLLTCWLKWKDVAQCDAAICSKTDRPEWLTLLRNECVFPSVTIGCDENPNNVAWLASRVIRFRNLGIGIDEIRDLSAIERWLREVGPALKEFRTTRNAGIIWQCIERFCHNLTMFGVDSYQGEDTCWNVILNNPKLVELRIYGKPTRSAKNLVPNCLSLPFLQKLDVACEVLTNKNAMALLKQAPGLRCLKVVRGRISQTSTSLYECLPDFCPQLIHLDLRHAFDFKMENDRLSKLMTCLKRGLHTLLLPVNYTMTNRDQQVIVQYHAHNLSCLHVFNFIKNGEDSWDLAKFLNGLHLLHTLQLSYHCMVALTREQVVNPGIAHLLVDFDCTSGDDLLAVLCEHCPCLTTLSLSRLGSGVVVKILPEVLENRKSIRTVCVDNVDLIAQLREQAPTTAIAKFVPLDIFSFAL